MDYKSNSNTGLIIVADCMILSFEYIGNMHLFNRVNSVVLYNSREWKYHHSVILLNSHDEWKYHHSVVLYDSPEWKVLPPSCVV